MKKGCITSLIILFMIEVRARTHNGVRGFDRDGKIQPHILEESTVKKTQSEVDRGTKRVIVKYSTNHGKEAALSRASNVYYHFEKQKSIVATLDPESVESLRALQSHVIAVDEDTSMESNFTVNNRNFYTRGNRHLTQITPYGVPMVQADQVVVPNYVYNRKTVCLADTGVLYTHPDLPQSLMTGTNRFSTYFDTELYWQFDVNGHGTCIAGIISANMTNNIGTRGVGAIPLYITRGMNNEGQSMQSDVLGALAQCADSGAKIISLSLGGPGMSVAFQQMLDYLYDELGILIFASAGNNGQQVATYPAAYEKVVGVGAVNASAERWFASDWGSWLELMAPGDQVWCTGVENGQPTYSLYSGTSMAAPYAAGVAALVWSHFPTCTNTQIRFALAYTAKDIGPSGCDIMNGNGIVQAKAAYDFLSAYPCEGATWGRTVSPIGCDVA